MFRPLLLVLLLATPSLAAQTNPPFDIPRLDKVVVDGEATDWGGTSAGCCCC